MTSSWDDLMFEQQREDERKPEWHPWDEKVFEDPANDAWQDADEA